MVSLSSIETIKSLWELQGAQRLWFVGSYSLYGMPLLETAVSSSVKVAKQLGASCPWEAALLKVQERQDIPAAVSYSQVMKGEVLASKSSNSILRVFVLLLLVGLFLWYFLKT